VGNKKNKILLIYPMSEVDYDLRIAIIKPSFSNILLSTINYFSKIKLYESTKGFLVPPLGLVNIATITPAKWCVTIYDERISPIDEQSLNRFKRNYDIIGITSFTANVKRAYYLAKEFRNAGKFVILGGYHASLVPDEALRFCNTIVKGFGELSWLKFLDDYENNSIKSIYYTSKVKYIKPDWSYLKRDYYLTTNFVEVSRGCHNKCNFCCISSFRRGPTYKDVNEVIEELKPYNNRLVVLVSDNLDSSKTYCKELFNKIMENSLNIRMIANISHEFAYDEELVKLASKAGLRSALIGFETINDDNIDKISKNQVVKADYGACIRQLHNYGIGITGCFIVGFEWDTIDTVKEIIKYSKKYKLECLRISPLIPYPGTPIYEILDANNSIRHNEWNEYHTYGSLPIYQDREEFIILKRQILNGLKEYYSVFNMIYRFVLNTKFKRYYIPYNISQWYKHNVSLRQ